MVETIQLRYKTLIVQISLSIISYLSNMILLVIFKNMYLYIFLLLIIPIVLNIYCHTVIVNELPFLKNANLTFKNINIYELLDMAKLSLHSMSDLIVLNSDNLIVSSSVGFNQLAIFSNFRMITTNIQNLVMQVLFSIKDPIRKVMSTSNQEYIEKLQFLLLNLYYIIANFVCISLIILLNPFVNLWLGDYYVLDSMTILLMNICLFLTIINYPIVDAYYFEECYKTDFITPLNEILINIVASVILALFLGMPGVFLGTLFYNIYRIWRRSKFYFKKMNSNNYNYIKKILWLTFLFLINLLVTFLVCKVITIYISNKLFLFIMKCIICCIVPNLISLILFPKDIKYVVNLYKHD